MVFAVSRVSLFSPFLLSHFTRSRKRLSLDDLALRLALTPVREEFSGTGRPKRISRGLAIDSEEKCRRGKEDTTITHHGATDVFVSTLSHKVGGGYYYISRRTGRDVRKPRQRGAPASSSLFYGKRRTYFTGMQKRYHVLHTIIPSLLYSRNREKIHLPKEW